jgi:hypothetical protein
VKPGTTAGPVADSAAKHMETATHIAAAIAA